MKKVLLLLIISVMLVGCGQGATEEEFNSFSSDFYTQMLIDGEQSEEVNEMYESYLEEYSEFKNEELHITLVSLYEGLSNGSATEHQLEAMKLLNEQ
jgi:uncharacterized protein YcfL